MATAFPLQIFYDGNCRVCSAEMDSYRARNPQNRLRFIDISSPDFCAEDFGRTRQQFMAQLHVRDADGVFTTGLDAFVSIWQAYPGGSHQRLLGALVGLPGIELCGRLGYRLFARYRHLLPKRSTDCETGSCRFS